MKGQMKGQVKEKVKGQVTGQKGGQKEKPPQQQKQQPQQKQKQPQQQSEKEKKQPEAKVQEREGARVRLTKPLPYRKSRATHRGHPQAANPVSLYRSKHQNRSPVSLYKATRHRAPQGFRVCKAPRQRRDQGLLVYLEQSFLHALTPGAQAPGSAAEKGPVSAPEKGPVTAILSAGPAGIPVSKGSIAPVLDAADPSQPFAQNQTVADPRATSAAKSDRVTKVRRVTRVIRGEEGQE